MSFKRRASIDLAPSFDPVTQTPTSATQFPPPKGLKDIYNKHLFAYPEIFRNYIQLHVGTNPMYSEAQGNMIDQAYICTLNHTNWKKPNKKADITAAQKLILKHITLFHLLLPIHKSILNRLNQVNEYFETHVSEFEREIELRFVESDKCRNFSQSCDTTNRRTCSPIARDTSFKELYVVFERWNRDLNENESIVLDSYFRAMYDDIQTSYEYVIALKASISTCHNEILCLQTIGLGEQISKKNSKSLMNENVLTTKSDRTLVKAGSSRDLHNDSSIHMATAKESMVVDSPDRLSRRASTAALPTAFDYYFSPDIICLLWQQEYERQYQAELTRKTVKERDRLISTQKIKNTVAVTGIPVQKIERGPFNLSRYTHWGAGLEITNRYLPDAQQSGETFSVYSLSLTGEELRGILSVPPPYHIIDRRKLGYILDMDNAKEFVNHAWVKQSYQQQFVCYTPRPGLPARVELSFLPGPPQKLYNLELTSLNYSLSGTPHLDTFIRYLSVEGDGLDMYSECRMDKLKDVYVCPMHHFKTKLFGLGKKKVDVKVDLYSVQKLILKHAIITLRLFSLLLDMVARLRTVMNDYEHNSFVEDWLESEKEMVLKTQSHAIVYGSLVDYTSTLSLLGIPFQELFNCYHRYTYNRAWLLFETKQSASRSATTIAVSLNETLKAKEIYKSLFTKHLPLSYELIFRLKILLYTVYDRIVIIQSLSNPRWVNEIKKAYLGKHISPDILCCLWFQKHYKPLSSLDDEDELDVQRKVLFRTPNCFISAVEHHQKKSFSIQSLTLSDEENRSLFRPPAHDAVIDVEEVLKVARSGFDGHVIPDWVYLAYCNRFSQYVYRPQIPTIRLPILPADVVDTSDYGNKNGGKTPMGPAMPSSSPNILARLFNSKSHGDDKKNNNSPGMKSRQLSPESNNNNNTHNATPPHSNVDTPIIQASGTPLSTTRKIENEPSVNRLGTSSTTTNTNNTTTLMLPQLQDVPSGQQRPEDHNGNKGSNQPPSPSASQGGYSSDDDHLVHHKTTKSSPERTSFRDTFLFRWTRKDTIKSSPISTSRSLGSDHPIPENEPSTPQNYNTIENNDNNNNNDEDEQPYIAPLDEIRQPVGPNGRPIGGGNTPSLNARKVIVVSGSISSTPPGKSLNHSEPLSATPPATSRHLDTTTAKPDINRTISEQPHTQRLSSVPAQGISESKQVIVDNDDAFFDEFVLISYQLPETP